MGQIVGLAAKCKRTNLNGLSMLPILGSGEYILISTDNSMDANGQGIFDAYIVGDGHTAATELEIHKLYENDLDDEPKQNSNKIIKSGWLYENCPRTQDNREDLFSIEDDLGTKILSVDESYIRIGNIEVENGGEEGNFLKRRQGKWVPEHVDIPQPSDITTEENNSLFSIEDDEGVTAFEVKKDEVSFALTKFSFQKPQNSHELILKDGSFITGKGDWAGKVISLYGDSVVAIGNGDFSRPYTINENTSWGVFTANFLGLSRYYGRGIGGQSFKWGTTSGSVSWVDPNGRYINRLDDYNFDSWNALSSKSYPSGVTAEKIANGEAITIRGCGCSWLRITKMFPTSIKDDIHAVIIMFHNDAAESYPDFSWIPNDSTDPEWAADAENYMGGDYNISTTRGGIASTIMKLQKWMPNAVIILATPLSGRGTTGQLKPSLLDTNMQGLAEAVVDMGRIMAIPVIDVFATCGINGLNRTVFISDSIHPYTLAGNKMLARTVVGGMLGIMSNF